MAWSVICREPGRCNRDAHFSLVQTLSGLLFPVAPTTLASSSAPSAALRLAFEAGNCLLGVLQVFVPS